MSNRYERDYAVMVVTICAMLLSVLFACCAVRVAVIGKPKNSRSKHDEEIIMTEEREPEKKHEK